MGCECDPIGSRRHRVTIERPKTTKDAGGHVDLSDDTNWQAVGSRWAGFATRGGRESRVFDQVQAETTHIIEVPFDALTKQVIPKWRLKMGTRRFNITAAYDVDERRRLVRIEATEAR